MVRLEFPDENGETKREYYARYDKVPADAVPINEENSYYYKLFSGISAMRDTDSEGPKRLQTDQIESWCKYTGYVLNSFEKQLILNMDGVFVKAWREERAKVQKIALERGEKQKAYSE